MIQPINWHYAIPILYMAIIVFTAIYVAVKHEHLHALIVMVAACFWPLYYIIEVLIYILENHDDEKHNTEIKKSNNFNTPTKVKVTIRKSNLSSSDINRIRKGRVVKVKKINVQNR